MGDAARVVMLVRNAYTHDTRVEKEARTLVEAGFRVTVVADAAPGLPAREQREGTDVLRVERGGPAVPGVRFIGHQLRLAKVLRSLRPDILHAHDSNALVPVLLAARAVGVPFVYDAHDLWLGRPRRERSRFYFALNQLFYAAVERIAVPRAAATITVSPPIVEHLRRRYRLRRVVLVPNYPDQPGTRERREIRALPGGEAMDPTRPIVLYLGGLMEGRGLEQLVDAVGLVPQAQLVLLGDGVLAERLRERAAAAGISDRVHLLAPVPPDEVIAHAASADVGVSPIVPSCLNYRYSLPNKLFQYMAAGIPVIASDFPQIRDILGAARCGVAVDTTQPAAIAAAVRRLLDAPEEARAMGRRGAQAVAEAYNWSRAAATLLDLYRQLIGPAIDDETLTRGPTADGHNARHA